MSTHTSAGATGLCVRCGLPCALWSSEYLSWIHNECRPTLHDGSTFRALQGMCASFQQEVAENKVLHERIARLERERDALRLIVADGIDKLGPTAPEPGRG